MSQRNYTDEILGWLETIVSLATRLAEWCSLRTPRKSVKLRAGIKPSHSYALVAPKVITSLKQYLDLWFKKQPIGVIVSFYFVFAILYFFVSKIISFVVVTGIVFMVVVIYQYEEPVAYPGLRGKLFIGFVWVFMAIAMTAPLYTPILILDGVIGLIGIHDG